MNTLEEFAKAFKKGDSSPMGQIFQEHGAYCVQNLQRKTGCDMDDAKDIFIEAVMNFRQRVIDGKITELSSLRNYLYTTCVNMQMAKNREKIRLINHQENIKTYFYQIFEGDAKIEVSAEEQESLFKICLQTLSLVGEKCAQLLKAFYVEEQSLDEIVEELDFSSKDVAKTSKSRCLKKWRNEIAQEMKKVA